MYHSISESLESDISPYYRVCTSPKRFADHMSCLANNGWTGVTLRKGLESLDHSSKLSSKLVAITFDDGFRDFYSTAFPILKAHGFSATMYLPTAHIGESSLEFKGRQCMTWGEVAELHREGIEFGSHTVNHPVLYELPLTDIESELAISRKRIEEVLNSECRAFAYPYAFPQTDAPFVQKFSDMLSRLGYTTGVTTMVGRVDASDNRLLLKRLPVNESDDWSLLEAKLHGAYDWLGVPQAIIKRARWWIRSRGRSKLSEGKSTMKQGAKT